MLKLPHKSIFKPWKLLFQNCRSTGLFLDQLCSNSQNGDKQLVKNYGIIYMLSICGKGLSNSFLMTCLNAEKIYISQNQLGFILG